MQQSQADVEIYSMDDPCTYGPEFHRLDFSEGVRRDLLTDYKVMVLAVDEKHVSKAFQRQLADKDYELKLEDAVKIVGCWNGLSKRIMPVDGDGGIPIDHEPMRRGVAFSRSIRESKLFRDRFAKMIEAYKEPAPGDDFLRCEVEHVDDTMNALHRSSMLQWLKEDTSADGNTCRILSNARCLSEGVDVPALDAVMFLNPRNSVVDVVQAVGRVMRKVPGKDFGYIILPIGIPADMAPEEALANNQKYKVVWQVLQALRAHDDRFNATINKLELNDKRPDQIQVIGVGDGEDEGNTVNGAPVPTQFNFNFPDLENWRDAIYARIVIKCGSRKYWEDWAKDIGDIAQAHITRIKGLLESTDRSYHDRFNEFLGGLRAMLNPAITEDDAIEMLAQHLVTKPVFDALFEGYTFTEKNPVSLTMQRMLDLLEEQNLEKEAEALEKFYESVHERAGGIDNAEGKQRIIVELYDKFFKTAFPRMADRLGIVYTPIEVVDFIIRSADEAIRNEFGVGLTDRDVHILDPFTGTGTFIKRIEETYAARTSATNKNALYDSYIRAIRWASDRIGDNGVICYVTNGTFIDGNSMDGLRSCLEDEFTSIYCLNLRGNQRTSGELSRQEGGKIFGSGSRAPIAITLLIKNPKRRPDGKVYYDDIGEYLTREQKLQIISEFGSVSGVKWESILPNCNHDWINQRDPAFVQFMPIGDSDSKGS
jgi:predicted helicase